MGAHYSFHGRIWTHYLELKTNTILVVSSFYLQLQVALSDPFPSLPDVRPRGHLLEIAYCAIATIAMLRIAPVSVYGRLRSPSECML